MKRCYLLLLVLFAFTNAWATDYYVDSSRPDDSGDGLSALTAKKTIQAAINAASNGDVILVAAGTYTEDVVINKQLTITGAGIGVSTVIGPIGGGNSTFQITSNGVILDGFTITRQGNNPIDWNATLNTAGVAVQSVGNAEIKNCRIEGNRTGIDINDSNGNNIHNNVITNNRSGVLFRNTTNNTLLNQNEITNNWTVGVLFLDASSGSNIPVQSALSSNFSNNNISGNWYGQIVDRQSGGSLPAVGTNLKYFKCNWLGTTTPVFSTSNSIEPGYPAQIPVAFGGTATAPGGQPDVLGPAAANLTYLPYLTNGTDNEPSTNGFQPIPNSCDGCPNPSGLVTNTSTGERYCSIQAAINDPLTLNGHNITVASGTYDEQVVVNKELTINGVGATQPIVNFTGTPLGKLTLFDVSANNVTISNINFKVDLSKLRSAIISSGSTIDAITISGNNIEAYGTPVTPPGTYGDRNAVSVNYGGPTNFRTAIGGVDNVVFQNNTVSGTAPTSYFRSAIAMDEASGTITGNTLQTINHDVLVRFSGNGPITISNNNLNGGGVELSDQNAAAGPINVSANTFDATFANVSAASAAVLRIKNNYNSVVHNVVGNTFTNFNWAASIENSAAVTLDDNTFTGNASSRAVVVNTKSISSNSSSVVQVPVGLTLTDNDFNGQGTALTFLNHDSDNDSYGTFTIGTSAKPNTFAATLSNFILFDSQTGSTNGSIFPSGSSSIPPQAYFNSGTWPTIMDCWATNIDARNNTFDVGYGPQLPINMSLTQRNALEAKLVHKPDVSCTGTILYFLPVHNLTQNTRFETIQAAIDAANPDDIIECSEGTYAEAVTITKSLTIQGKDADRTLQVLNGSGVTLDQNNKRGAFTIANNVTNVTIKNFTIQNYSGASGNANAGIYGLGGNNDLSVTNVTLSNNVNASGFYANGPVSNVSITSSNVSNNGLGARGIVIWNGFKQNINISNNSLTGNSCCGIELQDGTASGVTIQNNTILNGGDNAIGLSGLRGPGVNIISDNTITDCGRFGIEIKNPNGSGLDTGPGSIVVSGNLISFSASASMNPRDHAGIAVFRRSFQTGNPDGYPNVPTGVVVKNNTVNGYKQLNTTSTESKGYGIVIEGTNHSVLDNSVQNCDVAIQQQGGAHPNPGYVEDNAGDGNQNDGSSANYFGRGNSPVVCGNTISGNTFTGNGIDQNNIGLVAGTGLVRNTNNGETFCTIQSAINDANTTTGHVITAAAVTFTENVSISKSVELRGANYGVSGCASRSTETTVGNGVGTAMTVAANGVSINGFELVGTTGISSSNFTNLSILNSKIGVAGAGINVGGVATSTGNTLSVQNNCITLSNQVISVPSPTATAGIFVNGVSGAVPISISNNTISNAFYGLLLYGVNTSTASNIADVNVTGAMQAMAVVNTIGGPLAPSNLSVNNFNANAFATTPQPTLPAQNFNAGIYLFTAAASTTSETINLSVSNSSIDGTNTITQASAGIYLADFGTSGANVQQVNISSSSISNHKNRAVDARGRVVVTVNTSTLTNNGGEAFGTGDNNGFTFIAREGGDIIASNNFITHPASSTTPVTAFFTGNGVGNSIVATNNSILVNGNANATGAVAQPGTGTIVATCNWWGVTNSSITSLISGNVDFQPFLISGTDNSTDAGFQPVPNSCTGCISPSLTAIVNGVTVTGNLDGTPDTGTFKVCSGATNNFSITSFSNNSGIPAVGTLRVIQTVSHSNTSSSSPSLCNNCQNTLAGYSGVTGTVSLVNPANSGTMTVTFQIFDDKNNNEILDTDECAGDPVSYSVTIDAPANAVMSGVGTICSGGTANLSVAITGGVSPYTVVYTDGTINSTVTGYVSSTAIPVTATSTTVYSLVSVIGADGCAANGLSGSATINVQSGPNPTSIVYASTVFCSSSNSIVAAPSVGGTNVAGGVFSSNPVLPGLSATTGEFTPSSAIAPGVYTVNYSIAATNGCPSASISTTIAINNATPTISITPLDSYCVGITLNHSATVSPSAPASGAYTYSWVAFSNGTCSGSPVTSGFSSPSSLSTNRTWGSAGDRSVQLSVTVPGCTTPVTSCENFTVVNDPVLTPSASPNPVCIGEQITLNPGVTGGTGTFSYSWTGPSSFSNNTASPTVIPPAAGGTYNLTVSNTLGCSTTANFSVTTQSLPTASITTSPLEVCAGGNIALSATGGAGTNDYAWDIQSGGGVFSATNIANPSLTAGSSANTYSVSLTVTGANGCSASTSVSLTIKALPIPAITTSPLEVCAGATLALSATGGAGTNDYAWAIQSGGGVFSATNIANPSITAGLSANTYSVGLSVTGANGCTASTTANLTVNALPTLSISPASVCAGASVALTATSGMSNYAWAVGAAGSLTNSSSANPTLAATSTPGTYTVSLSATNSNNCVSSTTGEVTVNTLPSATLSLQEVCAGASLALSATGSGFTGYSWNSGTAGTLMNSSSANPTLNATATPGSYTISLSVTIANSCTASTTGSVTVKPLPTVIVNNASVCANGTVNLSATAGLNAYSWASTAGNFSNATANPTLTATAAAGNYTVSLSVTGANGCTNSSTASITILPTTTVSITSSNFVCENQAITLTATTIAGANYSWSFATGNTAQTPGQFDSTPTAPGIGYNSASAASVSFVPNDNGSITVSVTASLSNGCSVTAQRSFNARIKPVYTFIYTPAGTPLRQFCPGEGVTISSSQTLGTHQYNWSIDNVSKGSFSNTSASPTVLTIGANQTASLITATLSLSLTNTSANNGCSNVLTSTIAIKRQPVISLPTASSICTGTSGGAINITVTNVAPADRQYSWSNNATSEDLTGVPAGTYNVTVTNSNANNGCTTTASYTISSHPLPGGSISLPSGTSCVGNVISLGFVSSVASPALPYTIVVSGVSYTATSSSQSFSYTVTSTGTTTLQLTSITDANGCVLTGSPISSATVVANQKPTVTVAEAPNGTVCVGISINHSATVVPSSPAIGSYNYEWYASENGGSNTTAGFSPGNASGGSLTQTRTWNTPGNANNSYLLRVITPGCTDTDDPSNTFTVVADPVVSITPNPAAVCSGSSLTLTATPSGGTGSYNYSWDAGTAVMGNPNQRNTDNLTVASTFNVSISNTLGCNATTSQLVTVNALPVIGNTVNITTASCANSSDGSIDLTATGAPTLQYSWSRVGSPTYTASSQDLNLIPAGTYNVTVTDGNGCQAVRSGIVVGVNPSYNLSVTTSNLACNGGAGGSINLTVNGGIAPYTYTWTRNGVGYTTLSGSATAGSLSGIPAGTYNVTVSNSGCTLTGSYTITQPSNLNASLSVTQVACGSSATGSITLNVSGGTGAKGYSFNGPTVISAGSMPNGNRAFTGLLAGTFNVTVTDANSCSTTASVELPSFASPTNALAISFPANRCYGQSLQLSTNYGSYSGVRYSWAATAGFSSTAASPTVTLGTTTSRIYSVTATLTNCNLTATATASVTTKGLPNVGTIGVVGGTLNVTANTFNLCNTLPLTFTLSGQVGEAFSWRGPAGAGNGVFNTSTAQPMATVPSPRQGQYTITAGNTGCSQINQKVINVQLINCATRIASAEGVDTEGISIQVNPNPVEQRATILVKLANTSPVKLTLLQAGDARVLQVLENTESTLEHRFEIDMSKHVAGTYLLLAETEDRQATKKIVKVSNKE